MLTKYRHSIRNILLGTLMLVAFLVGYFLNISTIAFQKTVMIVPVEFILSTTLQNDMSHSAPDVRKLITPIPYQNGRAVFDILPRDRYHKTIEMGFGNCSNLSFGMAVRLLQNGDKFEIVHFIPYDSFLVGNGHTMLNMPYQLDGVKHVGLVDIMEGGLPLTDEAFISLEVVRRKYLNHPSIMSLNNRKDEFSSYYGDFLNNSAVGVVPSQEVARYFRFIDQIYIPLGNKRLERFIYSGVAMVLGLYPHTYVSREDYAELFAGKAFLLTGAQILIWSLRLIPLLMLLLLLSYFPRTGTREYLSKISQLRVNRST